MTLDIARAKKLKKSLDTNFYELDRLSVLLDSMIIAQNDHLDTKNSYCDLEDLNANEVSLSSYIENYLNYNFKLLNNFKSISNKSMLITALVPGNNYSAFVNSLKKMSADLAEFFSNHDYIVRSDTWYAKLLQYPTKPLKLVALFLTNNKIPQVVRFGEPFVRIDSLGNDNIYVKSSDVAQNAIFFWNVDKPAKLYESQLVNLDDDTDIPAILDKINKAYEYKIADINRQKTISTDESFSPMSYLTLSDVLKDTQYLTDNEFQEDENVCAVLQHLMANANT